MIKEYAMAWEKYNKDLKKFLEKEFSKEICDLSYVGLLKATFNNVINPYLEDSCLAFDKMEVDGIISIGGDNYQGTLVFIIPPDTYIPSPSEYVKTYVYYGSCSYCDTLQHILGCNDRKTQVNDSLTLCLHMLQRCSPLFELPEN